MKKLFIISLAIVLAAITCSAQTINVDDARKFRLEAYQAIQNYERWLPWVNDNDDYYFSLFMDLFDNNDNAEVYNDLMGMSSADTLTIGEYTNKLKENAKNINVAMKDVEMGPITRDGNRWTMDVKVQKVISYKNPAGIMLNTQDYYDNKYFDLVATMTYDSETGKCAITRISGSINSRQPRIAENFYAIDSVSKFDGKILANGKRPRYNSYKYAIYPSKPQFRFSDPDMTFYVVEDKDVRNLYHVKYRMKSFRIKPWANIVVGNFYKLNTNTNYTLDGSKSSATEFGLDFGYNFPTLSRLKIGVNLGVGMSMSNLNLDLKVPNFEYPTDQDVDGDTYTRQYSDVTMNQHQSFSDMVIPFYFELEYGIVSRVNIFVDLGLKFYMAMGESTKSFSGSYKVQGLYKQYDNLLLDQESGINDFTNAGTLTGSNAAGLDFKRKGMSMDMFGRIGLRVPIVGSLSAEVSAGYQQSLGDVYTNVTSAENFAPLQYDLHTGTERVNIPNAVSKFGRSALDITIGISYKF